MSKNKQDVIDELANFLDTIGINYEFATDYFAIGFRLDAVGDTSEWKDIIDELKSIAPIEEWYHNDTGLYQITHIDDVTFPITLKSKIYEENLRSADRQISQ